MEKELSQYAQAWKEYRQTGDYLRSESALQKKGITQPYADNILRSAFDGGYKAINKFPTAIDRENELREDIKKINPHIDGNGCGEYILAWRRCYDWIKTKLGG